MEYIYIFLNRWVITLVKSKKKKFLSLQTFFHYVYNVLGAFAPKIKFLAKREYV